MVADGAPRGPRVVHRRPCTPHRQPCIERRRPCALRAPASSAIARIATSHALLSGKYWSFIAAPARLCASGGGLSLRCREVSRDPVRSIVVRTHLSRKRAGVCTNPAHSSLRARLIAIRNRSTMRLASPASLRLVRTSYEGAWHLCAAARRIPRSVTCLRIAIGRLHLNVRHLSQCRAHLHVAVRELRPPVADLPREAGLVLRVHGPSLRARAEVRCGAPHARYERVRARHANRRARWSTWRARNQLRSPRRRSGHPRAAIPREPGMSRGARDARRAARHAAPGALARLPSARVSQRASPSPLRCSRARTRAVRRMTSGPPGALSLAGAGSRGARERMPAARRGSAAPRGQPPAAPHAPQRPLGPPRSARQSRRVARHASAAHPWASAQAPAASPSQCSSLHDSALLRPEL